MQVIGGAAGLIVIEEDGEAEGLPFWLTNMTEILLMVQRFDLDAYDSFFSSNVDYLTWAESTSTQFYLVNGEYQPTICMKSDEWMKVT